MATKKTEKKSPKTETTTAPAAEKDEKVLKVNRAEAAKLLRDMGFKDTHKYSNELLQRRLNKMDQYVANYDGTLDDLTKEMVDKVIAAKNNLKVTGDEPKGIKKDAPEGGKKADGKPVKERKPRQPRAEGPSNKEKVWRLYEKLANKEKAAEKASDFHEKIGKGVELNTVRAWISAWNHGKNLPGCAKKS